MTENIFPFFQQTKRKLDDAAKRLGYLYDKLREQSVRNLKNTNKVQFFIVREGKEIYKKLIVLSHVLKLKVNW